jgi:CRP-like cAMP-binding protein
VVLVDNSSSPKVAVLFPSAASPSVVNRTGQNQLLGLLPLSDRERTISRCERVAYDTRHVIYPQNGAITHVYFPLTGMISLVLHNGETGVAIEVGMVGNEGMAGLPAFLGSWKSHTQAIWQVGGEALKLAVKDFQPLLDSSAPLRTLLGRYVQAVCNLTTQSILCNNFHPVDERLCRWLLMTHDRVSMDELPLTHEFIAQMLGTRRPSVTVAAGMLQKAGLINFRRGRIRVVNRAALASAACECYEITRRETERLLLAQ